METAIDRRQTSFLLSTDLLERLQKAAKRENKSLDNFVESTLIEAMCYEPNEETIEAIEEARSGKFAGEIDMTNLDTFMKSINDIE